MTDQPMNPQMHYQTHVFCCVNQRSPGHQRSCCADRGSLELRAYMKVQAKILGIKNIRVNNAGCLERCELGPTLVIYPEGVWYTYKTKDDVDEILQRHIQGGERVERLLLEPGQVFPDTPEISPLPVQVSAIRTDAAGTRIFDLAAANGGGLPAFSAGAHIDVNLPSGGRRSFSIISAPDDTGLYTIGVRRVDAGRGGSRWLHDEVAEGDTLEISRPCHLFGLNEGADEHVFVAGDIGVAPVLSMGRRAKALDAKMTLHLRSASAEATPFLDDVQDIFGDNVILHHDGGDPAAGLALKEVLTNRPADAHLYLSGDAGLIDAARGTAASWPAATVTHQYFEPSTAAAERAQQMVDEDFDVSFARRKKILTVPVGKTILDVAREADLGLVPPCEDGLCGRCRTPLLGGRAEHRDVILNPQEHEDNSAIILCRSRARAGQRLVVDI